jgi:hypothetical protein
MCCNFNSKTMKYEAYAKKTDAKDLIAEKF